MGWTWPVIRNARPAGQRSCWLRALDYFDSDRIQLTSALMSASGTALFGGIGTGPQTPAPPVLTFCSSLAAAVLSPRYFAATWLYAGPTIVLSTAWQAAQPSFCIIAWPDARSSGAPAVVANAAAAVGAAAAAVLVAVGGAAGAAAPDVEAAGAGAAATAAAAAAGAAAAAAVSGGSLKFAPERLAM